jgi:glycosyltransferase involved in cell wall biosynthesis
MEYAQSLGLDANVVHSNVCDVEGAARHIKQRVPVGERDFTVLYCGRLLETKGVHLVLQTALLCTHDRIRFVIMGSGPLEPEVRKLVDEHRAIEYLGSVAGAERFSVMAQVDVLLLPSLVEPWGVVVQEALAVGTPVVVSANVGCIPEFVEGFQTGTVTDTDAVAIRLALLELRALTERDPALSERCIAAASRHTYASATRELVEALARVLENGKVEE